MLGPLDFLTLIFILLKVRKKIQWSWWWVFSPLILEFTIALILSICGVKI